MLNRMENWVMQDETGRVILVHPKDLSITSKSRAWAFSSDSKRSPAVAFNTTGVFFQRWGGTASMAMSSNLLTVSAPWKEKDVFLMVSSYRPSESRPPNSLSTLVKPVFNSRRHLTHTQLKYKNCARHLVRTLKRMSTLEGRVYSEIYLGQEKCHCL